MLHFELFQIQYNIYRYKFLVRIFCFYRYFLLLRRKMLFCTFLMGVQKVNFLQNYG